jgi:hypothetical protein
VAFEHRDDRDPYLEVGSAAEAAIVRAIAIRLTGEEWRVFSAVLTLTMSYSRFWDWTSIGQLAGIAQLTAKRTSELVNALARYGVVAWMPTRVRDTSRVDLRAELQCDAQQAAVDRRRRRGTRWNEIKF